MLDKRFSGWDSPLTSIFVFYFIAYLLTYVYERHTGVCMHCCGLRVELRRQPVGEDCLLPLWALL